MTNINSTARISILCIPAYFRPYKTERSLSIWFLVSLKINLQSLYVNYAEFTHIKFEFEVPQGADANPCT